MKIMESNFYFGQWKNGKFNGRGLFLIYEDSIYLGEFKVNQMNGQGIKIYCDKNIWQEKFKVDLVSDMSHIEKCLSYELISAYSGNWIQNKRNGFGILIDYLIGRIYSGYWQDDQKHGEGELLESFYYSKRNIFVDFMTNWEKVETKYHDLQLFQKESRFSIFLRQIIFKKYNFCTFKGQWKENQFQNKMEIYDNQKTLLYIGESNQNYQRHGIGENYHKNGVIAYRGEWRNNQRCGQGSKYHEQGMKLYQGEWQEDKYNGFGKLYFLNGILAYEGNFVNNECLGYGEQYFQDGNIRYKGESENGIKQGQGELYYQNGNMKYKGRFCGGHFNGYGQLYFENGNLKYKGYFRFDIFKDQGELYYENGGLQYKGYFDQDQFYGQGEYYYENGNLKYSGEWKNNRFSNFGIYYIYEQKIKNPAIKNFLQDKQIQIYYGIWQNDLYGQGILLIQRYNKIIKEYSKDSNTQFTNFDQIQLIENYSLKNIWTNFQLYDFENKFFEYQNLNSKIILHEQKEYTIQENYKELKIIYKGNWKNLLFQGHGLLGYNFGLIYDGYFTEGKFDGEGQLLFIDGSSFKGQWKNGQLYDQGIYSLANGQCGTINQNEIQLQTNYSQEKYKIINDQNEIRFTKNLIIESIRILQEN